MSESTNQTIGQKFRNAVKEFQSVFNGSETVILRKDSNAYQSKLSKLISDFISIQIVVDRLSLFSDNETIDEINTNYIPFANTNYYLGVLYMNFLLDEKHSNIDLQDDKLLHKMKNLSIAKNKFLHFLNQLQGFGQNVLNANQTSRLNSFKETFNPTFDEIVSFNNNPTLKRAEKISNYKLEKELNGKLEILFEYYDKYNDNNDDDDDILKNFDEEIVKNIFIDQLRLNSIHSFSNLELIVMEIQVLSNRPEQKIQPVKPQDPRKNDNSKENDYGYTPKLESLPFKDKKHRDLISKQGRVLQPFTITSNKQELRNKVFGTGQVLPSMSVEEYLDYELANGKMMKEEVKDAPKGSEDEDSDNIDSDEELEKRLWDDWKDENPKGSGNMGANLG